MPRRIAASFVLLATLAVGVVPCAGWQGTAEARHDCCASGHCPAEFASASDHTRHSGHMLPPAADRCCAFSEQQPRSSPVAATAFVALPPLDGLTIDVEAPRAPERRHRAVRTTVSPPVRLHLLFSVHLV